MGVIYRLKPEIKDFILENKKAQPNLSCRQVVSLVEEKFQIKLSKSSINSVFKQAGLSMPIGRRLKKRRYRAKATISTQFQEGPKLLISLPSSPIMEKPQETPLIEKPPEPPIIEEPVVEKPVIEVPPEKIIESQVKIEPQIILEPEYSGAIILKAVDYLLGGTYYITEALKNRINLPRDELLAKTEACLYRDLKVGLDRKFSEEVLLSYLNELQGVNGLAKDIFSLIQKVFPEVRGVKVNLSGRGDFYLDGQFYTVWSTPYIPADFSSTLYNVKHYINRYLQQEEPFVLFMAPGYDAPTKEFFDFMLNLDSYEKIPLQISLLGNKFEKIEHISVEKNQKLYFVFGLWPWQFGQFRSVKAKTEFRPYTFEPLKEGFYIAEIEVELLQPNVNKRFTLKGIALKKNPNEKVRLFILNNLSPEQVKPEDILKTYLNHWPNLEEAFQDFSRKIELFTYTAGSQRFFSFQSLQLDKESQSDINTLFKHYLRALDLYARWHFLPSGYEDKDFPTMNERFYSLSAHFNKQKDCILVSFKPAQGYPFLKDLQYACRRINEREVFFSDGKRLWLSIG